VRRCGNRIRGKKKALLLLVTDGGSPDAAYKITRNFQDKYESFTVLVSGRCKSAGTLIAVGANELAFTPYGELGPLDIQVTRVDRFDSLQSGLTIQDSLNTLETRALESFIKLVNDYMMANNGLLSFASATKAASDFVTQLYAPIFARIDPEEVGARARSMRIATDYGSRLAIKSQNLKPNTLKLLAEKYSSHSFVIDQLEAEGLFNRVRAASEAELAIVEELGRYARFEVPGRTEIIFCALSKHKPLTINKVKAKKETSHATTQQRGNPTKNGGNSKGPSRAARIVALPAHGRERRAQNGSGRHSS